MVAYYDTGTVSSSSVWYTWSSSVSTTNTYTTPGNTWGMWTSAGNTTTSSITYSTNVTWTNWVETEEQKLAREAQQAQWAAQSAERDRVWREQEAVRVEAARIANEKAETLLLENIPEEEVARYKRAGYFFVHSQSGKKYKVKKGTHGNVFLMCPDTEKEKVRYCVQPNGVPVGDANLAQALYLKFDEAGFLARANATQLMN